MRKHMMTLVVTALFLLPAGAQEQLKRAEVYGGYQLMHFNPSLNANGWNASISGNVNRWFGVTSDFGGLYKNGQRLHSFMVGPTFSFRTRRITPFAHVLVGGVCCDFAFSTAIGGGLDVKANDHLAIRLIQADWMIFHVDGGTAAKNARVSTGLVFRF